METGRVLWFNKSLGYGFIEDKEKNEIFFHWTAIQVDDNYKTVCDGQPIEFEVKDGKAAVVVPVQRYSGRGKPILLVCFSHIGYAKSTASVSYDVFRKADMGIKYITIEGDIMIGLSEHISSDESSIIAQIIKTNFIDCDRKANHVKQVIYVDELPYDIMFV
jgi:CspA family cold shock protein